MFAVGRVAQAISVLLACEDMGSISQNRSEYDQEKLQ